MKPDERIFRMMLEGQRASADNTLFIDDGRKNVEAASRMGIHTLCPLNNEDWTGMLAEALKL
jgi:putative hydrolase of the HAD superfamily